MKITCANCGFENPTYALYCVGCGLVLASASRTASTKSRNVGAWIVFAAVVGLSIVSGVFTFGLGDHGQVESASVRLVDRGFDLDPSLADAMFDLLAPSDIKVIVGKRSGGVFVRGTPEEVEVLSRFVLMLTDHDFAERSPTPALMRIDVQLPRSKARALVRVLQCAESPVLLSGSGRTVTIRATEAEHEIINGIINILRGRR